MIIKVDYREKKLLKLLESFKIMYEYKHIKLEVVNLELGDFIICDDLGRENVIFERKSLSDLASSIKDGRYAEQSFRLNNYNFHNHNIVYIIEGDLRYWQMKGGKYNKMPIKTFYTTILSLQYYKGFSVMRTNNVKETAEYIIRLSDKMLRDNNVILIMPFPTPGGNLPKKLYARMKLKSYNLNKNFPSKEIILKNNFENHEKILNKIKKYYKKNNKLYIYNTHNNFCDNNFSTSGLQFR